MELGKLSPKLMEKLIFPYLGAPNTRVELGPAVGEDAAVINVEGEKYLVVSSDPIVGADEEMGFYLVHINANDVASKGGDPSFFITTIIVPESWNENALENLMREIDRECKKIKISLIGGHTEVTKKFKYPILSGTMFGFAPKLMKADNIRPGDKIILTKGAGIEGTSILARVFKEELSKVLKETELIEALELKEKISVVEEARILRKWAVFMHDPTEGGILGGLYELKLRSGLNININLEDIPIPQITQKICSYFKIDPLKLIGSGALLAVIPESDIEDAIATLLNHGIKANVIGTFTDKDGNLPYSEGDELWKLLSW
ncbi:MAG: AIR synthase family protein [Synergistetes bacterium]|nr:AIR synthase family protein [Synergistota bacterium]MCX8127878.1 AIR synthase family protein [Synergistota bacterium]MDW8192140.1 AIR synthase family protein [Synergistota bacterium]